MARKVSFSALESRSARLRLKIRRRPYSGPSLARGISLMYRRNKTNGTWVLKASDGHGAYWTKGFALADDFEDSDGKTVLTFYQAQDAAKKLARGEDGSANSAPITLSFEKKASVAKPNARKESRYLDVSSQRSKPNVARSTNASAGISDIVSRDHFATSGIVIRSTVDAKAGPRSTANRRRIAKNPHPATPRSSAMKTRADSYETPLARKKAPSIAGYPGG